MPYYFLRIGDDHVEEAQAFLRKAYAVASFAGQARELARVGQRLDASIHIADTREELDEYPDFVLSLGPRGGVRVEHA